MEKEKKTLGLVIKHWFTHHTFLKLISLLLAILVWFYIKGEIHHMGG